MPSWPTFQRRDCQLPPLSLWREKVSYLVSLSNDCVRCRLNSSRIFCRRPHQVPYRSSSNTGDSSQDGIPPYFPASSLQTYIDSDPAIIALTRLFISLKDTVTDEVKSTITSACNLFLENYSFKFFIDTLVFTELSEDMSGMWSRNGWLKIDVYVDWFSTWIFTQQRYVNVVPVSMQDQVLEVACPSLGSDSEQHLRGSWCLPRGGTRSHHRP